MEYPLFFVVIQKSTAVLLKLLTSDVFSSETFDLDYYWAVRYAMQWPDGLRQFLSKSSENIKHHSKDLFEIAIRHSMVESFRLLIEAELPVSKDIWGFLCQNARYNNPFYEEALPSMARLLRHQTLADSGIEFYYTPRLSLAVAEALWTAGFQHIDFDALLTEGRASRYNFTALETDEHLKLLQWFVEKGARLDVIDPYTYSTLAHETAVAIRLNRQEGLITPNRFFRSVFGSRISDRCVCPCSAKGCLPIGLAITRSLQKWTWHESIEMHQETLQHLYDLIDSSPDLGQPWMASTCLRVLTFEDLGMTHTCCTRNVCGQIACTICFSNKGERQKLLVKQEEEIETLEFILEDFEGQLEAYQGNFKAFLEEVWRPKMKEIADAKIESWGGLLGLGIVE
jgi:hypothetical protein